VDSTREESKLRTVLFTIKGTAPQDLNKKSREGLAMVTGVSQESISPDKPTAIMQVLVKPRGQVS